MAVRAQRFARSFAATTSGRRTARSSPCENTEPPAPTLRERRPRGCLLPGETPPRSARLLDFDSPARRTRPAPTPSRARGVSTPPWIDISTIPRPSSWTSVARARRLGGTSSATRMTPVALVLDSLPNPAWLAPPRLFTRQHGGNVARDGAAPRPRGVPDPLRRPHSPLAGGRPAVRSERPRLSRLLVLRGSSTSVARGAERGAKWQ